MSAPKKKPDPQEPAAVVDIDALIAEANLPEPPEIRLRWKGADWRLRHVTTMPGSLTVSALEGDLASQIRLLELAVIAPVDPDSTLTFDAPSAQQVPVMLQAWLEAGGEQAAPGESQPSTDS